MNYSIAIHGGAGTITRASMTPEKEAAYIAALSAALKAGNDVLSKGGTSLEAVTQAVVSLEDCPLFNAGKGSVFTAEGKHEMDASVMCGQDLTAGAVSGVKNIRNPVLLAKAIMENSEHVFLYGAGAEKFAKEQGLHFEADDYFYDALRYEQLQQALASGKIQLDHTEHTDKKFGTVGAVALDQHGNLAACTSTGGMTNKHYNRIGDSPVIGSGTYANNKTCAISCTGHGEFFIRAVVAYDISCLMEYAGLSLQEACDKVVMDKLVKLGGEGGLIAVDSKGNVALPFNSEGMYRGWMKNGDKMNIDIYK
jgi:L-asparaginase / beta-aspartyl-peptidase